MTLIPRPTPPAPCPRRGVSLIEILIGILIVAIASIGTLTFFAYGRGNIGKTGNRRAALERARQRLEQVLAANISDIQPPIDPNLPQNAQPQFWLSCTGSPCTWARWPSAPSETVDVDDQPDLPIETTVKWQDDPSAGTSTPDTLEFGVKVWFVAGSTAEDDFHRVHLRTLRTP